MRTGLLIGLLALAGCGRGAEPRQDPANSTAIDAITAEAETREAAEHAGHPRLAGVDLHEVHAFGADPRWQADVREGDLLWYDASMGKDASGRRGPLAAPVLRDGEAIYTVGKGKDAVAVLTLTPGACSQSGDDTPLRAELRLGALVRRGCAGSPWKMRDGWD